MKTMICLALTLFSMGVCLQAQSLSEVTTGRTESGQLRYQLQVMERVFEEAVEHNARELASSMEGSTPGAARFMGPTRARGFRLDGYGLFFDMQIPVLRRSLSWVFRHLNRQAGPGHALRSLREHVRSLGDVDARDALEHALRSFESLAGLPPDNLPGRSFGAPPVDRPIASTTPSPPEVDPAEVYAVTIREALTNAMLDYTGLLPLAAEEWLTVATTGGDHADSVVNESRALGLMLRVRGNVLIALRQGKMARSEALSRIEYSEF